MLCIDDDLEPATVTSDGFLGGDTFKPIVSHENVMAFIIFLPIHICGRMIKMNETQDF